MVLQFIIKIQNFASIIWDFQSLVRMPCGETKISCFLAANLKKMHPVNPICFQIFPDFLFQKPKTVSISAALYIHQDRNLLCVFSEAT